MRGKERVLIFLTAVDRITPAYAGKREKGSLHHPPGQDHPRVCGEKLLVRAGNDLCKGSPPRMRGKVRVGCKAGEDSGITPAYAGKRQADEPSSHRHQDHPRVCGEKIAVRIINLHTVGSPPRMRGKGQVAGTDALPGGITPAYAGKSVWPKSIRWQAWGSPPRMRGKD